MSVTNFYDLRREQSRFAKLEERLNLQDLGNHLRNGGDLLTVEQSSFSQREREAREELHQGLLESTSPQTVESLLPAVDKYADLLSDISFSLGLKSGARLALLLTTNFESDF